ncbi:MAG: sulfite oxidase-like oxidoreductase [Alicyclobacillaceae bacterium]|nr:sulfite oxidase-like oxidoreductase [Alicyclobacillaceae bacterium]
MSMEAGRVPPGQFVTDRWPVLHAGSVPEIDLETWRFELFGLVERPVRLTYQEFMRLPQTSYRCDIHCVTTWSRLDNVFEGVPFRAVLDLVTLKPEARYVLVHAYGGWTTNLPLEELMKEGVLFAHSHNGKPLTPKHGWPLRLVVPHLYFWKSAKWVKALEFLAEDVPGYWEERGYHMVGDPWLSQRYRDDPEWGNRDLERARKSEFRWHVEGERE